MDPYRDDPALQSRIVAADARALVEDLEERQQIEREQRMRKQARTEGWLIALLIVAVFGGIPLCQWQQQREAARVHERERQQQLYWKQEGQKLQQGVDQIQQKLDELRGRQGSAE